MCTISEVIMSLHLFVTSLTCSPTVLALDPHPACFLKLLRKLNEAANSSTQKRATLSLGSIRLNMK